MEPGPRPATSNPPRPSQHPGGNSRRRTDTAASRGPAPERAPPGEGGRRERAARPARGPGTAPTTPRGRVGREDTRGGRGRGADAPPHTARHRCLPHSLSRSPRTPAGARRRRPRRPRGRARLPTGGATDPPSRLARPQGNPTGPSAKAHHGDLSSSAAGPATPPHSPTPPRARENLVPDPQPRPPPDATRGATGSHGARTGRSGGGRVGSGGGGEAGRGGHGRRGAGGPPRRMARAGAGAAERAEAARRETAGTEGRRGTRATGRSGPPDATHVWTSGDGGPGKGPCEQTPSRATHPRGGDRHHGGRRLIVKRRSDRRSPGRNPGPQVRSKCR